MTKKKDAARKAAERYVLSLYEQGTVGQDITRLARLLRAYGKRDTSRVLAFAVGEYRQGETK
jgi:uncharacterized protein YigE (DUF2233 family)